MLLLGVLGLRIREAAALQISHVDFENGRIRVTQAVDASPKRYRRSNGLKLPKTNKTRVVHVAPWLIEELRPLAEGRDADDWLFTGQRGGRVNVDNFRSRHWTPAVTKLDYREGPRDYVTPHWLRHTAATAMLKSGVNPGAICSQLGWANVATFFGTYAGWFSDDADDIIKAQREAWTI